MYIHKRKRERIVGEGDKKRKVRVEGERKREIARYKTSSREHHHIAKGHTE